MLTTGSKVRIRGGNGQVFTIRRIIVGPQITLAELKGWRPGIAFSLSMLLPA